MIARAFENEPVMTLIGRYMPVEAFEGMVHYPTAMVFGAVRDFQGGVWNDVTRTYTTSVEILEDFLANGGVVNTKAGREDSLLHIALDHCQSDEDAAEYDLVKRLLQAGADWTKPDSMENTPLHVVAHSSSHSQLQLLRWARQQGTILKDFVNSVNDLDENALKALVHPRRIWRPSTSDRYCQWRHFMTSGALASNAELLMALGARVSRRVVIMLRLIIPTNRDRPGMTPGNHYGRVADSARWIYDFDQSIAHLPAELIEAIRDKRSYITDGVYDERFRAQLEELDKPCAFEEEYDSD
ncbi:hypothetical protein T484DRAFT_3635354 [Baffinella frigidus]|nr:hypothetical protein T484DRAFT_3635354 [Cryptophyta sp. CCMP2293]